MSGLEPPPGPCQRCGQPVPRRVLAGHCSRCLVATAFGPEFPGMDPEGTVEEQEMLPRRLGEHDLLEVIGRGGMGVVYRARHLGLQRDVALKVLPGGGFAHPEARKRFRHEALAAARLQHPNIVAIHEVGEAEGISYYSMDLVTGPTLAELLGRGPLPVRTAAGYLLDIARAIHQAHQAGVLHRDLKPSNILIDAATDQPRVTDFGLARRFEVGTEDPSAPGTMSMSRFTVTGQAIGSPAYMPPEQVLRHDATPGPASDVYSLGAILYQAITGRVPFEGTSVSDVLLQVREVEPIPPRRLNAHVPVDLETLCLKCMAKDPAGRYPSAADLAADLGRFLEGTPILARPVGTLGRLWSWCKRRPVVAGLSAGLLFLLTALSVGAPVAALRIAEARRAEEVERRKSDAANVELRRTNLRLKEAIQILELQRIEDLFQANDGPAAVARLAALLRTDRSNSIVATRLVSALVQRRWALPGPTIRHVGKVNAVEFSPDGRFILSGGGGGMGQIRDANTGHLLGWVRHGGEIVSARFSRDGNRVVTASTAGSARVWNATNGASLLPPLKHGGRVNSAEFSVGDRLIVTASDDRTARVWNAADGRLQQELGGGTAEVTLARFSPDGSTVATASADGEVCLHRCDSGERLWHRREHRGAINALTFSPDGRLLASAGADGLARLFRAEDGEASGAPMRHGDTVHHVVFHPQGGILMTTSQDGLARLWETATCVLIGPPLEHEGGVNFGVFATDGSLYATTGLDCCARLWNMHDGSPAFQPLRHHERVVRAAFDPAGGRLVTAAFDAVAQVWQLRPPQSQPVRLPHTGEVTAVALSRNGDRILAGSSDGSIRLWDPRTGQVGAGSGTHPAPVAFADFTADGTRFVTCFQDGEVCLRNSADGREIARFPGHNKGVRHAEFSPDGEWLVTASGDGTARIWNAHTGEAVGNPLKHGGEVIVARFSPDGRWIATGAGDRSARVWNAATGEAVTGPLVHLDHVLWVDFSPDGSRLITASGDRTARIWNATTGEPAGPALRHGRNVLKALFLPDGRRVATVSLDTTARIWDAATGEALTEPMKHDAPASILVLSADGERLLTGAWNGRARLWDARTGRPLTEWIPAPGAIVASGIDRDARYIALATGSGVQVWEMLIPPTPAPEWLPDFAEAVAGARLSPRGDLEIHRGFDAVALSNQIESAAAEDPYRGIALRFLNRPAAGPGTEK